MKQDLSSRLTALTPRLAAPALAVCAVLAFSAPASADGWGRGGGGNVAGAVAAGIIGGAAIGALAAGAAAAPPPPAVVYPAQPVYAPGPVYAAPPPGYPPGCWVQRQQVWNGYGWVWRRVRVCN
jgi:hypothetical protein